VGGLNSLVDVISFTVLYMLLCDTPQVYATCFTLSSKGHPSPETYPKWKLSCPYKTFSHVSSQEEFQKSQINNFHPYHSMSHFTTNHHSLL